MAWQTQVASWVIPLLADYTIPDDAQVITGVEFGTLDDATSPVVLSGTTLQADYPGLVPDFSLDPELTPTTGGTQYNLKAKKAVGFYGVDCDVISYDDKRLNKWTFPLLRRNFGYAALSRYSTVVVDKPIHYGAQFIFAEAVQALTLNYDDDFSTTNLFNSVDKFCCTKVSVFLYPEVELRVRFLPVWELWAVRFLQSQTPCDSRVVAYGPPGQDLSNPGPYRPGDFVIVGNPYSTWGLFCVNGQDADPVWVDFGAGG